MKKFICLLLALSMIASITACSGKSDSSGSSAVSSGKDVTITLSEHVANIESQSPHVAAIVKDFMKANPNIKIDMSGSEVTDHITKMKLAAQNNNLPDIIWLEQPVAKDMAAAGYLYDLTSAADSAGINNHLLDGLQNACTVSGKNYGFPSEIMMSGFYYNKAIFSKYNVKVPVTFDDFLKAVDTFNKNGIIPISDGAKSNFDVWAFQGMLNRYGFFNKLDDLRSGKVSFTNDDFIHFYEKVKELRDHKAFSSNVVNMDYFQAVEQFTGGKAAMLDSGAWEIAKLEKSSIAKDIGFFFGPTFSDGVGEQMIGIKTSGGVYSVSAKAAKDPDKLSAIIKFFAYYYGDEGTSIIVNTNQLPTTKFSGKIDQNTHPVFATMVKALNDNTWKSAKEPFSSLSTNVGNKLFESIWGVINGVYTPKQAAQVVEDAMASER